MTSLLGVGEIAKRLSTLFKLTGIRPEAEASQKIAQLAWQQVANKDRLRLAIETKLVSERATERARARVCMNPKPVWF